MKFFSIILLVISFKLLRADVSTIQEDQKHSELRNRGIGYIYPFPALCSEILDAFAQYASNFTMCSIQFARPIRLCEKCIDHYLNFYNKYKELKDTVVNGTSCRSLFISHDRLDAVADYYTNILAVWTKGNCDGGTNIQIAKKNLLSHTFGSSCLAVLYRTADFFCRDFDVGAIEKVVQFDDLIIPLKSVCILRRTRDGDGYYDSKTCYDWNGETPKLSNKTKHFNQMYVDTMVCLNTTSNDTKKICDDCKLIYIQLDDYYKTLSSDSVGVDKICMDIVDSMNATRSIWSKSLNCCQLRRTPETIFLCCTGIISLLPLLYYIALRYCGPIRDLPNVLKQSRFKQTILRSVERND